MAQYRRYYRHGGSFFFTVVTARRARILTSALGRVCLRSALHDCLARFPFRLNAIVLLPDHLHAIWTLPHDDEDFSKRWGYIKKTFTQLYLGRGGLESPVSSSQSRERRRGIWQRRFWEHLIRDELDFERHFDYVHYNPVKHALVRRPRDWPHSTFHRCVAQGHYQPNWGAETQGPLWFGDIKETAAE